MSFKAVLFYFALGFTLGYCTGCGGRFDIQCDGPRGIDCSLIGLPVCTTRFGDVAPSAFCTRPCVTDEDCGSGSGACALWYFPHGQRRVCVAAYWTEWTWVSQ